LKYSNTLVRRGIGEYRCVEMSQYLRVAVDESLADEAVELPTEEDGTLLLSVLVSQFEGATGR